MLSCEPISALCLLSGVIAVPTSLSKRADNPDEAVVLAECDNGKSGTEFATQDRMHYFSDDYARRNDGASQDTVTTIHDPARHDGFSGQYHIGWTSGTEENPVSATFPEDGRQFKAWGLTSDGEPEAPISGTATFGGAEFKCYKPGSDNKPWTTQDGYSCAAAYVCTRADRWIRHTSVKFDDKIAQVGSKEASCSGSTPAPLDAKEVFSKFKDIADKSWNAESGIDIGGGCKMVFPTVNVPSAEGMPGYDTNTPQKMADIFVEHVGAKIEETRTHNERNCFLGGSQFGGGSYDHVIQEGVEYPHGGRFEITTAKQSDPKSLQVQMQVDFRVDCSCESDSGLLNTIRNSLGLVGWIHPAFGVVGAAIGLYDGATC
ncbi:uncharacterized protein CC84DRAFT_1200484 [Paraphaeosphaeria sporulosa]|uniref:Uncharacterized protein n=1 Tax=Paraphaeosphaeria sporulosa TaxID=1460663 RepID=A0A177BW84_9PLEO|nr:uncharacterized protein CC84DRAFT_1200484 [Paraphaeosphaeria sporulosa]OAF98589.1 hypothetical protein CC84DRAFT_1200484 [Paraphaeosphaeria sporulosa]